MAAGTSIFTLMGSILVDSSKAEESISKTEKKAEGLGTKLGNGIKTAAKWGAAITGAAIAGGAALFGMASKAMDALDRIDKLSQKIGISRTAFQEWEYILSQSGTDIEKLQVGLKTMVQRMDETVTGTGKGAEMFEKLGVSVTDSTGAMRKQEEVFEDTVRALQNMPEGAEKSRLAFELFGKAGMELMPLLNDTNASLDDMQQATKDLGIIITDEAVDAGVEFQDRMDDLKRSLTAVTTNIGVEVIPIFHKMALWVVDHMPQIQAIMHTAFDVIRVIVTTVFELYRDYVLPIFDKLYKWTVDHMPQIQAIMKTVFQVIWDIVKSVWDIFTNNLIPILKALYDFIAPTFPIIGTIVKTAFDVVIASVNGVIKVFERVTGAIKTAVDWLTSWNKKEVKDKTPRTDGSHAGGLPYVPKDDYLALLHKGERVLTAEENMEYNKAEKPIQTIQIAQNEIDYKRLATEIRVNVSEAMKEVLKNSDKKIELVIDGRVLARTTIPYFNKENERLGVITT